VADSLAQLRTECRPPKGDVALTAVNASGAISEEAHGRLSSGFFEFGSLTKTLTATMLARLALEGVVSLDTTVGRLVGGKAGAAQDLTLLELATHTSGLPRIAPNTSSMPFYPRDPYRFYGQDRLWKGLSAVSLDGRGDFSYSNLGYMLLGQVLASAVELDFASILRELVLLPAGMETARCQPCARRGLLRGHGDLLLGGRRWNLRLPGASGVEGTISDLAQWTRVNVLPDSTPLEAAIRLAQQPHAKAEKHDVGLGWMISDSTIWHNGGTGRFHTLAAFLPGN
jgi:serine-type D-Ala-D-Ala carboxypeptidase/endopeptidase